MNVADGITSGRFLYEQYLDVSSPQVVSREPKHASPSNLRAHGARFPFRAVLHPKLDFSSTPYTDIRAEFPLPGSSPLFRENSSLHLALVHMVAVVERETGGRSRRRSVRVVSGGKFRDTFSVNEVRGQSGPPSHAIIRKRRPWAGKQFSHS